MKGLLIGLLLVASSLFGQSATLNRHNGGSLTCAIIGHSQTRTMYSWLVAHPTQLPQCGIIEAVNHDSYACAELLALEPFDLNFFSHVPDVTIVWNGGTDVEQQTQLSDWIPCAQQYAANILTAFPSTEIVWPNINADSQRVGQPESYLTLLAGYNGEVASMLAPIACGTTYQGCAVTVDVHTTTTLPSGWGNPNLEYIDFFPFGWQAVMFNFRVAVN